ncbi:MAG: alpha/beta hydrolase [Myxococcota bacterium]|nr:alpha/beta hydrolase [Myxococcota bacterium]
MASPTVKSGTIISFDGTPLHYAVTGSGSVDFVLCDGIGCDGFIWRYLKPVLESRGRVIHMHMRGHGQSGQPAEDENIHIRHIADDWSVILAALGRRNSIVLGHSMGVQVGLELWRRHPQHVDALVLMCGSYQNPIATFHDGSAMETLLPLLRIAARLGGRSLGSVWRAALRLPIAFHVARLTEVHPDLTRREDFEPYLEHLSDIKPSLFFEMLNGASQHSADHYLDDVDVPTLVIAAGGDQFTPSRLSKTIADRIPEAELLVIPEGTHTAPIEFPSMINSRICRFLDALKFTP